jgi:hypothetical protein
VGTFRWKSESAGVEHRQVGLVARRSLVHWLPYTFVESRSVRC